MLLTAKSIPGGRGEHSLVGGWYTATALALLNFVQHTRSKEFILNLVGAGGIQKETTSKGLSRDPKEEVRNKLAPHNRMLLVQISQSL